MDLLRAFSAMRTTQRWRSSQSHDQHAATKPCRRSYCSHRSLEVLPGLNDIVCVRQQQTRKGQPRSCFGGWRLSSDPRLDCCLKALDSLRSMCERPSLTHAQHAQQACSQEQIERGQCTTAPRDDA